MAGVSGRLHRLALGWLIGPLLGCAGLAAAKPALASPADMATAEVPLQEIQLRLPAAGPELEAARLAGEIPVSLFLPAGQGPFPLALIHHERRYFVGERPRYEAATRYFLAQGYAVALPLRAGYGERAEAGDRESVNCQRPQPGRLFAGTTLQAAAVLEGLSAAGQPIDRQRVLHVGVGVGGFAALSAAILSPQGVLGAINFGGGAGGYPERFPGQPCGSAALEQFARQLGRAAARHQEVAGQPLPSLWIYAANDRHFAPRHAWRWHLHFRRGGGRAELHQLPAWGEDGNHLFDQGRASWQPLVDEFLRGLPPARSAASDRTS